MTRTALALLAVLSADPAAATEAKPHSIGPWCAWILATGLAAGRARCSPPIDDASWTRYRTLRRLLEDYLVAHEGPEAGAEVERRMMQYDGKERAVSCEATIPGFERMVAPETLVALRAYLRTGFESEGCL
jgi:hypothetical protein